jgi:ATP-dependent RNA helicase RhlE
MTNTNNNISTGTATSTGTDAAKNTNTSDGTFYGLGIAPGIIEVLEKLKFTIPTPIQSKAIPIGIDGKDIIGIAQTGTGKTLAFGIPMVQRLAQVAHHKGLIVVPTRELAIQVNETIIKLAPAMGMKTAVLIGGESMYNQLNAVKMNPKIIIATPGRLLDHVERRSVRLDDVSILVLDEADRMLDMGFMPQIDRILRLLPKERQTMLFSATMPGSIVSIAQNHMKLPIRTEIAPSGTASDLVSQEVLVVKKEHKFSVLIEILKKHTGSILLFTRTKRGAQKVAQALRNAGHKAAEIHSDRSMGQRKEALTGFKTGKFRVLVATDIAARGIDVTGIEVVVNYDLPDDPENYVHRIGRTGRAGKKGHAISLATPDQKGDLKSIEHIMRMVIPISTPEGLPIEKFESSSTPAFSFGPKSRGRGRSHR